MDLPKPAATETPDVAATAPKRDAAPARAAKKRAQKLPYPEECQLVEASEGVPGHSDGGG